MISFIVLCFIANRGEPRMVYFAPASQANNNIVATGLLLGLANSTGNNHHRSWSPV